MTRKAKAAPTPALVKIEGLTKDYADARDFLGHCLTKLHEDIACVEKSHRLTINRAVAGARAKKDLLEQALEEHKNEFVKPRTQTFYGIKVGFRKLIGKIAWPDAAVVVALIKKKFSPERQQLLIRVEETPVKDAIERLSVAELKSIGCSVGEDTDVPVITVPKTDIQKFVDELLKQKNADAEQDA